MLHGILIEQDVCEYYMENRKDWCSPIWGKCSLQKNSSETIFLCGRASENLLLLTDLIWSHFEQGAVTQRSPCVGAVGQGTHLVSDGGNIRGVGPSALPRPRLLPPLSRDAEKRVLGKGESFPKAAQCPKKAHPLSREPLHVTIYS